MKKISNDLGRELRANECRNLRGEAVIDGVMPEPGFYLVHVGRQRCYGPLTRVSADGCVLVCLHQSKKGRGKKTFARHDPNMLIDGGYTYSTTVPVGDGWTYRLGVCDWSPAPPADWLRKECA